MQVIQTTVRSGPPNKCRASDIAYYKRLLAKGYKRWVVCSSRNYKKNYETEFLNINDSKNWITLCIETCLYLKTISKLKVLLAQS